MKKTLLKKTLLASIIFILGFQAESYAQTKKTKETQSIQEIEEVNSDYNMEALKALRKELNDKALKEKEEALLLAKKNGWKVKIKNADGTYMELQKVVDGKPIYNSTNGIKTVKSTRINHLHSGGSLGLNLMGQGMTAYVWDAGAVRLTHQEFDGAGGNNRFSIIDGVSKKNDHAQHVAGIIGASGFKPKAKGVAPHAKVKVADWNNDHKEVIDEIMNGMLISNHSYNTLFREKLTGALRLSPYYFGGYIEESRDWDRVMFNAQKYLMVVTAGNEGSDNTANKNSNSGFGFDKLTDHSTAKNNLVVANAQDVHVDENGNFISAIINSGSSQGPTDDFRIKPDITAVGTNVYSTIASSDTAYENKTGTSMAAPNVTGSLLLLQQHHKNTHKKYMKAATLKGLALHTADDAGVKGPDAIFGWGILNAKKASQTITEKGKQSRIEELTLYPDQTYEITVTSDGTNPLLASISWTDRPGTATRIVNSKTPVLVNDLDLRISKNGTTYLPYKLTGATTNTKADNNVDPFERVGVSGASGTYTITVRHKGTLTGGSQNYSLIITGITDTSVVACNVTVPKEVSTSKVTASSAFVNWNGISGATYDVRYRASGSSSWITKAVSTTSVSFKNLSVSTQYEVQVRSKCSSGNSAYSSSTNFTTYCESKATNAKDQHIQKVVLGSIDNSSTDTKGYSDYTSISTKLVKGAANIINITPKSTTSEAGYGVWIDYNRDGDFSDDGEKVWNTDKSKNAQVSGTFTVPLSAKTGPTKMRVVLKKTATPKACETFAEGEVEEYTVIIIPKDTTPPTAPSNINVSNISSTGFKINWEASSDTERVDKYEILINGTIRIQTNRNFTHVTGADPNTIYSFTIVAKDATGNISKASNTLTFKTLASDYCTSKGTSKQKLYIKKVELGCINSPSIGGEGYSDRTTYNSTDLIKGISNKITITPSSNTSKIGYGVWIDYNKDGDFADDGEKVWDMDPSKVTKAIGDFTIPLTVENGKTRMRVVLKKKATPTTACETFEEGEVEDYIVNIITSDTKSPTVPSNVKVSNISKTNARVSWSTSLDNIGVTEYEILNGEKTLSTTANAFYTITDLKPNTPYTLTVRAKDKAGNVSAKSNSVTFTTYCASKATNAKNQYIQKVALGSINNTSTSGDGYSDHTSISTNLAKGATNTIAITPKSIASEVGYGVWIDYNQDGDFSDKGEKVWTKTKSKDAQVSGTFKVPSSAKTGSTRMRVILNNKKTPTACETFEEGEIEEYTVNIVSKFTETEPPTVPDNLSVSNISQTSAKLNWEASKDNLGIAEYEIFQDGKLIYSTRKTSYAITGLTSKTSYRLAVLAKDAAGNTSHRSNAVTFKTLCVSKAQNATNQYIKKVELGTIDHYSTSEGGYSDYTSIATKLVKGATNTIAVTPKSTTSDAWYAVWIDYNRDGKFEEAEKVWTKAKSKEAKVSGTFTVPSTAKLGKTTMRIALRNNGTPTACGIFAEGEVEEYTVTIVKEGTDVTPHTAIRDLKAFYVTQTSVKLVWSKPPTSEGSIKRMKAYQSKKFNYGRARFTEPQNSIILTGLEPNTEHTINITLEDEAGNKSKLSNTVTYTTLCKSEATNGKKQYISKVVLGNIDNTSTDTEGYSDYATSKTISTKLAKETANTITITPKSTTSDAWYAVWIDYNRNGKFEETEKVWTKNKSKEASASGAFTIPVTVKNGSATMRIAISNKKIDNACNSFTEGEVEDYTIDIVPKGSDVTPHKAPTNLTASNITQTGVKLSWDAYSNSDPIQSIQLDIEPKDFKFKPNSIFQNSAVLIDLKPNTTYTISLRVKDKARNMSKKSNTVTFKTLCVSKATNAKDQYIQKVVLNTINNPSTETKGYSDYTSISTGIAKEASNTITITPKSNVSDVWYAVWIDYNRDGDFEDIGEKVWTKAKSKEAQVSGTFTIPPSVKIGSAIMRVVLNNKKAPTTACGTFEEGEVEDYTINIVPKGADITPPTAPEDLRAYNITRTSVKISYKASVDNRKLDRYIIYRNGKLLGHNSTTNLVFNDLKPNTSYTYKIIAKDEAGNKSKASSVTFKTFCVPKAMNAKDQYIQKVVLGTINKTSTGGDGYSDYASISTRIAKGTSNTITITPKSNASDVWYAVWIDYNQDGDFSDAEEKVWTKTSKDALVNGTFKVPSSAKTGRTRMRIVLNNKKAPTTACETFAEGEVEDYTVNIFPEGSDVTPPTAPTNLIVTNITQTGASLSWDASKDNIGVTEYELFIGERRILGGKNTFLNLNLSSNTLYTFTIKAKDKAGNISTASNAVTLTTYCKSKVTNAKDQYIQKVVLGTINKTSTETKGYSDYTSISTRIAKGVTNTITITPKNNASDVWYAVWIDYNQDGDFSDAEEKVWTKTSKDALVNGTFKVPSSAKTGRTRMRIVLNNKKAPTTACETFAEGEVEDYTVNIFPEGSDVTPPTAPTNLIVTNITQTGASLSWDASKDNIGVTEYELFIGERRILGDKNTFLNLDLNPNILYTFTIKAKDKAGNISKASNAVTLTTYCKSKATNAKDQHIQKVVLGTINNPSTDAKGYSDYTSISTKLAKGATNTITITPKNNTSDVWYAVWIDYNRDGDFEDIGEKVWTKAKSKDAQVSGTFKVPSTAKLGTTRMRVVLNNKKAPAKACETFAEGEVEDYTVTIFPKDTELPTAPSNLIVSDITKTSATLAWSASKDNIGVAQYEVFKGETSLGSTTATSFKVSNLKANTEYTVYVKAKDRSGNVSKAGKKAFKTQDIYCVSKATSGKDQYIQKVILGTINNSSTGGKGHSDHTKTLTKLVKGENNAISITPKSSTSKAGYAVWIDYNQDKDFDDEGEKVWAGTSDDTDVKGIFAVPFTAKLGKTRIRIVFNNKKAPTTACETFEEGEVEDYTVTIVPDTELPTAPDNLTVSNITKAGATISWDASEDNVGIVEYEVFRAETSLSATANTSYTLTDLKPNTTYTVTIKAKDKAGNVSKASKVLTFKTQDAPYCIPNGNSSLFNSIKYVSFGGMTNTERFGNNFGYSNSTSKIATVAKGSVNKISINSESFNVSQSPLNKYFLGVWIDFNQNRIFEPNEKVVNVTSVNGTINFENDITIPSDAILGLTRMRILFKSGDKQTPCETFSQGKVEDYTVSITDSPTLTNRSALSNVNTQISDNKIIVYPNPALDYIQVKLRNSKAENLTYRIISIFGQVVKRGKLNGGNISIYDIQSGTYILEVDNGQKLIKTRLVKK
ncbi:GEVED domain-containing protein [Aquimarina longa]|uniref:GEVED domain-containing protein n=1 Tax=Aquimarina longa TaxID=1080221 RepID=UPI000785B45E|nr:GEVED domain-containing protein [Aquimarina longa]